MFDLTIATLEQRMGGALFKKRLRIEQSQTPIRRFAFNPKTYILRALLRSRILQWLLRVLGFYHIGHLEYLNPRVVDNVVPVRKLHPSLEGLTILQLSDLHLDLDKDFLSNLFSKIKDVSYDMVVITGDFRNYVNDAGTDHAVKGMIDILAHLRPPVYGVLGNHDVLAIVPPLEAAGMRFLLNEHVVWNKGEAQVVLAGVDDPHYFATHDIERALAHAPNHTLRILLSHTPSLYREADAHGVHLMLAGHTHGGQFCLPGGAILLRNDRSPRNFLRGAWRYGKTHGYTSSGTGASCVPLRFNCPAEIVRHILKRA